MKQLYKIADYLKPYVLPLLIVAYILGTVYVIINKRPLFYVYSMLPLGFFLAYTALFHLQKLVFFLAFCTPLAISLKEMGLTEGPDLSIPTEPIMAGMMLLYALNQLHQGLLDRRFLQHPITRIIFIQLTWMLVTTFTSTDIIVSAKYLISRMWFIFSCYLIMPHLFQNRKNIITFSLCYAVALLLVVFYTLARHAGYNFNDKAADWVVDPFYNDHTAYGAALAMFIPLLLSFTFLRLVSKSIKLLSFFLFLMFMLAIVLSFARAGWLSLSVAVTVFVTLLVRIRFRTILLTLAVLGGLFFSFQTDILIALGRNNTDAEGSFGNNLESVSNISTDASNLERLNRWSCAIRMWQDKPLFGWGPGTYMFKYAPYQLSREWTIISTNFGTNGNAHSEYLGPLSEQGILGILIVIALLLYSFSLGYRLVYSVERGDTKVLTMGLFLGLVTYFVHGFLNNFLDTDKLSLPFWGFLAALVSIDLYYGKRMKLLKSEGPTP